MGEQEEKIIEALTTISEYCKSLKFDECCSKCLLGSDKGCKVKEKTPDHWIINRPDPVKRLLK